MKLFVNPLVFLCTSLGLLAGANAAKMTTFYITNYGGSPVTPLPTGQYTATTTFTRTVTTTSTPKTTITPPVSTATKTVTTTVKTTVTFSKTTNTYTSTSTISLTATATATSVTTSTNTAVATTTNTDPATATPSPDFTPLSAELAAGGYNVGVCPDNGPHANRYRRTMRDMFKRNANVLLAARQASATDYPTSVSCTSLVYATTTSTLTITASTTSTKSLNQQTTTQTTTVTTTSTSTKIPSSVSLTVTTTTTTVTSTTTITSTTAVTTTSSSTVFAPASTVYPACNADNQVQCANGDQLANPHFTYNIFGISDASDAQSCCIACSQMQNCGGSFFNLDGAACYGVIADTCQGGGSFASVQVQPGSYAPYVYSNSNCGRWTVRAPDS